ncbi:pseudouridine synthase [Exidia glandulosa HHB12029]|uniref:Pseudouridine synthase n=1 Tax=Exidia glandulosa HHB12029 TaxID=1314781 RepID=A0A165KR84_EXIGL|nr:pseudouridine synthase [Exidia glandulosa HHB12029]
MDFAPFALSQTRPGLKKVRPYWHPYRTNAKERWLGREMLELISSEFRDRSVEYYRYALEAGVTTVNGKPATPDLIVKNGDRIENIVHRHEPPVTATPVRILHVDKEREFIVVDKPGSIPVHATGRYFKNSLVEILRNEHGIPKPYTVNRLDRLTSGLMIIATSAARARILCDEFLNKAIKKEYIARCIGCFPEGEVVCDQPMLTVDRQMGLNIVHSDGKPAKTIFTRLFYDPKTDSSVLHCQPVTGRSHQIRVHLQYLGYPIANDPVYSDRKVWGQELGRGGLSFPSAADTTATSDVAPDTQAAQPARDASFHSALSLSAPYGSSVIPNPKATKALPRETGEDIGAASPIPLTREAVGIIARLRNMKDEGEDWSRWRDVIFRAKESLKPKPPVPGLAEADSEEPFEPAVHVGPDGRSTLYCPECYLPLHPDPSPEKLYIFLHAKKYSTAEWSFETEMPAWAQPGFEWER